MNKDLTLVLAIVTGAFLYFVIIKELLAKSGLPIGTSVPISVA